MAKPGQNMPKLSWKDQLIYWTIITPLMGLSVFGIFISLLFQDKIAFADSHVLAATVGEGNLNCFFLMLWCMAAFVVVLAGFQQHRVPIFGRKDVTYGPPKYDAVYPLLSKDRPKKTLNRPQKKWRIIAAVLMLGSFLFSAAMFPRSFYGRAVLLDDGTISVYNASNELVRHYSAKEISSVQLDTYASGKYNNNWTTELVVYTEDSEFFRFASHSFRGDELHQLEAMLAMKEHYGELVRIDGSEDLDSVIRSQKYDYDLQVLLLELFRTGE